MEEEYREYLEYCRRKKALPMAFEDWSALEADRRTMAKWIEETTEQVNRDFAPAEEVVPESEPERLGGSLAPPSMAEAVD